MSPTVRLFLRNLFGTFVGVVLIGAANLALGETWPEVQQAVPRYVVTAVVVAALITAYEVWKRRRATPK